jgi:hypothetical protein
MGTTEFYLLPCKYESGFSLLREDQTSRLIAPDQLDLARAASNVGKPSGSGALSWGDVDWDDTLTTLAWDRVCGFVTGCLVLSAAVRRRLVPEAEHPAGYERFPAYEFMSIVRWSEAGAPDGRRFRGFHVEILEGAEVQVRQHLSTQGATAVKVPGFDWTQCDAISNGYSTLDASARAGDSGAVFIEPAYAKSLSLRDPKIPLWD